MAQLNPPDLAFRSVELEDAPNPFSDLIAGAESRGFSVRTFVRPKGPDFTMSVEWLAEAGFSIILGYASSKLIDWMRAQATTLWHRFFNPQNPDRIEGVKISGAGLEYPEYSIGFSMYGVFRFGRVKVIFPGACTQTQLEDTIFAFLDLMAAYARGESYDGIDLDTERDCYRGIIVVTYDQEANRLQVLNPFWNAPPEVQDNLRRLEQERRAREGDDN